MEKRKKGRGLPAGIAVEASYVMAMVILALAVLIKGAYGQCGRITRVMNLHCAVQMRRSQEEPQEKSWPWGYVSIESGRVKGYMRSGDWEKQITVPFHEPEETLRKLTIPEEMGGRQ